MKANPLRASSAATLLREAAQWRLLALLLNRPTAERKAEVATLVSEVGDTRLAAAADAWCQNATEGAYLQLLGPGGLVPARAVAYRPFADPGGVLSDIARHHRAFGFDGAAEEPADHIAVLADFVAYLLVKEAYARETADNGADEVTRSARRRFIEEHISPVASRLAERLEACGAGEWGVAAQILADQVPAPRPSALAPPRDDTFTCGGCETGSATGTP